MKIIESTKAAYAHLCERKAKSVLVPTMGALHRGHLELIRLARERAGNDGEVAVSIFVNPLQFEPGSDFEKYPRPQPADEKFCADAGVNLLFRPREMYFDDRSVYVEETRLSAGLCGASRPGHFRGVCTVVAKLFHLLAPNGYGVAALDRGNECGDVSFWVSPISRLSGRRKLGRSKSASSRRSGSWERVRFQVTVHG